MGEGHRKLIAQQKLLTETKIVAIDFEDVGFALSDADRKALETSETPAPLAAARIIIGQVVQAAFPDGMDRKAGRLWAGWQEMLSSPPMPKCSIVDVTQGQMEWLRGHLNSEMLKLPVGMAQWREALCEYLDRISTQTAP